MLPYKVLLCQDATLLLHMNVLNDVIAAPFSVVFLQLAAEKKDTKNGAAVTSLRTFVNSNNFRDIYGQSNPRNGHLCTKTAQKIKLLLGTECLRLYKYL